MSAVPATHVQRGAHFAWAPTALRKTESGASISLRDGSTGGQHKLQFNCSVQEKSNNCFLIRSEVRQRAARYINGELELEIFSYRSLNLIGSVVDKRSEHSV